MDTIFHTVDIAASPNAVFAAITDEEGLSKWWTTVVDADDEEGGEIEFTIVPEFSPRMEIVERGFDTVVWKCIGGSDDWADSRFTFEIQEREGGTVLYFTQDLADDIDRESYGRYNFNWGFYLQSLCTYCEKGVGIPFEPPQ